MTAAPITIVGFSSADKFPGFVGEVQLGAGGGSVSSSPLRCLLVGTKGAAGSAVVNQDIKQIFSAQDADTYFQAGFELSVMCYEALKVPGVQLWAAPVAEAVAAAAATATITITGTPTASGTWAYRVDGKPITGGIASTDTPTTIGTSIANAINSQPRLAVTAVNVAGVVTLTRNSKGARGNQGSIYQDLTAMAPGVTSALTGGTTMTNGGFHFVGGTGVESPASIIALLFSASFERIGLAQNDATNLNGAGLWRDTCDQKAGPLEGRPGFYVFTSSDTLTTATTLVQANNDRMFQGLWYLNSESHPSELTAFFAAYRSVTEQSDPDASYDGAILTGIVPQTSRADWPQRSTCVAALNNGLTPVATTPDGKAYVIRSITAHSLNGANPDYSTLDTSDAYVPYFALAVIGAFWKGFFQPNNPRVNDDPATGQKPYSSGVAYPSLWTSYVTKLLRDMESGNLPAGAPPILVNVSQNLPSSGYDPVAKRIMSLVPVQPAPNQHQIGVSVRQVNG